MTALPAASDFTGAVTQGDFKTAHDSMRSYLAGLLGEDGTAGTALQTLGALAGSYVAKAAAYTVTTGDRGRFIDATTGTWTLTLPAASSAGEGFSFILRNSGSGVITIDPASTELINGVSTLSIPAAQSAMVSCTGSAWSASLLLSTLAFTDVTGKPTTTTGYGITDAAVTTRAQTFTGNQTFSGPILASAGSNSAPAIAGSADTDTGLTWPTANNLGFVVGGVEAWRMTSAGSLYSGSVTNIAGGATAAIQIQGGTIANIGIMRQSADNSGPYIVSAKSRGTAVNTYNIVQTNDLLFRLFGHGADGTTTQISARMDIIVEGTPASGDVRAGFRFNTGSGASGAITSALVINTSQQVLATGLGGLGYGVGAGGTVTQTTSRTTGVTLDKPEGRITLVSAAGTPTWASFDVTCAACTATDVVVITQVSGSNLYQFATKAAAGSFKVSVSAFSGTATETVNIMYAIIKGTTN